MLLHLLFYNSNPLMFWRSYENNNVGNMAWIVLKVDPPMADTILARFWEWVLKVSPLPPPPPPHNLNCSIPMSVLPFGLQPHSVSFGFVLFG